MKRGVIKFLKYFRLNNKAMSREAMDNLIILISVLLLASIIFYAVYTHTGVLRK